MESGDQMRLYGETSSSSETTQGVSHSENGHSPYHHPETFYSVYHYQQFMPSVAVLNEGLPPPPGLSPPCGAPPGFYYPPQQPPPHHLYYGQSPPLYTPVVPMPIHEQQQSYGHFQYFPATAPPVSPLSAGPETMLDRGDSPSNSSGVSVVKKLPVIDPMIENIVGSMSMSTNGTYTPFGPSVSIASTVVGGCRLGFGESEDKEGRTQPPLLSSVVAGAVGHNKDKIGIVRPRVIGMESGVTEKVVQRAATPKEGTDSRPQTPGKLSYSEVLTKNEARGSTSSGPKVSSAPASNSPSPGPGNRTGDQNCCLTPGAARRTSVSSLQYQSDSVCKDAFHSNSSSSSSSPVTKPKLHLNNTFETVTNKASRNKENSSSTNSSKSSAKNTPSATPTHSTNSSTPTGLKGNKTDRRVLNVSNSQSSGGGGGKVKTVPPNTTSKPARNFPFEFDIEDLDDFQDSPGSDAKSGIKRDSVSGASTVSSSGGSKNASGASAGYFCNPPEKKPSVAQNGKGRGGREKPDRQKNRKGGRDSCIVRRVRVLTALWALHLISALNWLYKLIFDVGTLSCSLALSLIEDGYNWWKANAFPSCCQQMRGYMTKLWNLWARLKSWKFRYLWRRGKTGESPEDHNTFGANRGGGGKNGLSDILSMMGPDRNITLPVNGEEALKRLMSVKGQDPYSILGIRSDSSDETIRRYYKRQAVLVHPDKNMVTGAEEAFKILARAFELIGEPAKRIEYHRQLLEAHQKELVFGEIGNLLEQLRKKIESVSNSIRCTKCNSRHKKNRTDRPLFAARYCAQCRINHGAREGDLWAERTGLFGWSRSYYACMESGIWEVNEWASCQKKNLKHLLPDCHSVMYRLVAGGGNGPGGNPSSGPSPPGATSNSSTSGSCCSGGHTGHKANSKAPPTCSHHANGWDEFGAPSPEDSVDPNLDDWDSLISNLVRNPGSGSSQQHHHKNTHGSSSSSGGAFSGSKFSGLGGGLNGVSATVNSAGCPPGVVNNSSSRRRGKAKRK